MTVPAGNVSEYIGALSGEKVNVQNGTICVNVKANSGDIWLPVTDQNTDKIVVPVSPVVETPVSNEAKDTEKKEAQIQAADKTNTIEPASCPAKETNPTAEQPAAQNTASAESSEYTEAFEKGKIAGLQEAILAIMEKNGCVTDQMRKDVTDNAYHDSLINWIKSFR